MKTAQEGAMRKQGKPRVYGEMLSFRVSAAERIEIGKLANRRKMPVSVLLRQLVAQAAAQRNVKSGAAQSNTQAA